MGGCVGGVRFGHGDRDAGLLACDDLLALVIALVSNRLDVVASRAAVLAREACNKLGAAARVGTREALAFQLICLTLTHADAGFGGPRAKTGCARPK
jgi:hypothetical protein